MKKIFFLIIFLSAFFTRAVAQNSAGITPDTRLYECFDSAYIKKMQQSNPSLLAYYNFYLAHSFYTVNLNQPKPVTGEDIHNVLLNDDIAKGKFIHFSETSYDPEKFNALKYRFLAHDFNFVTYIWNEAGIALVFLPRDKTADAFKKYKKENNIQ